MLALVPARAEGVSSAAVTPPDFSDALVATVASPIGLAFTPDGRLLIATQPGLLRIYAGGALLPEVALDLSARVCTDRERGLQGVAVDPDFVNNRFIYLYYTFKKSGVCEFNTSKAPVNRVSRFILAADNAVDPTTEVVLIDGIPSPDGIHNGGDLRFGKDGYLYVTVGDGGCDYAGNSGCAGANDAARDRNVLLGKVLRITADGGVPPDNPFLGANTARCNVTGRTEVGKTCQETYAWGLRNPFRFGFDPNAIGTRFFVNDVGQNTWEEVDEGTRGADYGWNVREGPCVTGSTSNCGPAPAGMTNPISSYPHTTGCKAVTGAAFVPAGVWPTAYDGAYLYSDYVCGKIFLLRGTEAGGYTTAEFASGLGVGSAISMLFGPAGGGSTALFYASFVERRRDPPDRVHGKRKPRTYRCGGRIADIGSAAAHGRVRCLGELGRRPRRRPHLSLVLRRREPAGHDGERDDVAYLHDGRHVPGAAHRPRRCGRRVESRLDSSGSGRHCARPDDRLPARLDALSRSARRSRSRARQRISRTVPCPIGADVEGDAAS